MKKLLPWLVSLLLAITLIVIVTFYFWNTLFGDKSKDPEQATKDAVENVQAEPISADELVKVTSELIDIRTNLADTDYVVQISFSFQFDSQKAKEEFDKIKENQIKPIINRALWVMSPDDMNGTKGKDQLTAGLINSINSVLSEGKLVKVGIKGFIMTPI
ncbi:flagellar basal body-associated FliL family protein [Cohnella silvisoli]|uniref:Flagellar protein FliL n=1 Tax=Cohnella silvisoli TaxID=2873699 RepID=A0ABV1KWV7_9BACL|nr:flagellar basal body-associated FliL family protein [Cohnella silvisoli]MCD9023369.1 flagellar basal body-associated FliL family protein [Cohnella silvisoli]